MPLYLLFPVSMVAPLIPMDGCFSIAALSSLSCLYGVPIDPYGDSLPMAAWPNFGGHWGSQCSPTPYFGVFMALWASVGHFWGGSMGHFGGRRYPQCPPTQMLGLLDHFGGSLGHFWVQWGTLGVTGGLLQSMGHFWGSACPERVSPPPCILGLPFGGHMDTSWFPPPSSPRAPRGQWRP